MSSAQCVGSIGRVSSGLGDNSLVRVIITLSTFQTILGTVVPERPTVSTFTTSGLLSGLGGSGLLSGLDSSLIVSGLMSGLGGNGLDESGLVESGFASVRANTTLAISSPVFGS